MYAKINGTKVETYPLTQQQVMEAFPNISFANPFTAPAGYVQVAAVPQPFDVSMDYTEGPPAFDAGVWHQTWIASESSLEVVAQRQAQMRADLWERIKTKRDYLSDAGGYPVTVAGVTKWFHSDSKSKTQQLGLFIMGASVPAVQWKTMDGTFVTMNQSWAQAIFMAAAQQDMALFAHSESLRAQVDATWDPSTVNINAGWPQVFAGVSSWQVGE